MKQYKKIAVCLFAICFAFALTACNDSDPDEFTSLQSFEYHFFPEEYEEEYSEYEKVITLEADTDYQFKVDAACESGTIEIGHTYENAEEKMYIVNSSAPCNDKINIPANTTETAYFTITIDPETKGDVCSRSINTITIDNQAVYSLTVVCNFGLKQRSIIV